MENVPDGPQRVDIHLSINPEFELRLASVSVAESVPTPTDFAGNKIEVGHAWFTILSEAGEIRTGALLALERAREEASAQTQWRLVAEPRPALAMLAEAMGRLVLVEAADVIETLRRGLVSH